MIRVRIRYLGGSYLQTGTKEEVLDVPSGMMLGELRTLVFARHAKLAPYANRLRWARNHEFAEDDAVLAEGDELALLPPVCGGAPRARLTLDPLEVDSVIAQVRATSRGAVALFVGMVRDNTDGHQVDHIIYEPYQPMAERQIERLCAKESQDDVEVAVAHRYGLLHVGDLSVVIAAASPHRHEAFAACEKVLHGIKHDVPIWKREIGPDGETWVGWGGG